MEVKCPCCGKPAQYSEANPYRPFCSERCKTIDLGAWASEKYTIPVANPTEEDLEKMEDELERKARGEDDDASSLH